MKRKWNWKVMSDMKKAIFLILVVLLVSGCVDNGGHWQQATATSIDYDGTPSHTTVIFNDTSGNIYVLKQTVQTPFSSSDMLKLKINETYLVHVTGSGYVDKVEF